MLPYTRGGLVAAVLLGGGRAVGEAIAVTQVIGTTRTSPLDLFQTGDTLASRIAAQYQGGRVEPPGRFALLPRRDPARDLAGHELRRADDRAALRDRAEDRSVEAAFGTAISLEGREVERDGGCASTAAPS